ncbi:MAG: fructose-bisphosphatase class II, partial [Candidatus Omnitrophica bacterium]|nr:fructose-bisphosphatase class II [Candidatus Omnitrophota bacterium]
MVDSKLIKKIASLLLALIFVSTATVYPFQDTLRVPLGKTAERLENILHVVTDTPEVELIINSQFKIGYQPVTAVADDLNTETTAITAAVLTEAGLRGKARGLDKKDPIQRKEIAVIKDAADSMAKKIYQRVIEGSGSVVHVHVSEGFGRDALSAEDVFQSNERINPRGTKGRQHAIVDVVEGTNSFVTNADGKRLSELKDSESGATSIMITGSGVKALGNCPDCYVHYIGTTVSPEKRNEFTGKNALDPELIAKDPAKIEGMLSRIANANNIGIGDLEVVVMARDREKQNLDVLAELQKKYAGLKVVKISDGTVAHSLEATFGRKEGKHKVVMTVGGAPEGFFNLAIAGSFKDQGALASMRIYSMHVNETASGEKATNLATRYIFDANEIAYIKELRPSDGEAVLKGERLFTQEDVKGNVEGSMAFITN